MSVKKENGKYEVLNLSTCQYFEVDKEWLENVNLQGVTDLRFTKGHKEILETISYNGISSYYENVYGSWAKSY